MLMIDEVYQQNIYQGDYPCINVKDILMDIGVLVKEVLKLVSFHIYLLL
nr:hypothetical protein PHYPA_022128 [Physcomitrium patens]